MDEYWLIDCYTDKNQTIREVSKSVFHLVGEAAAHPSCHSAAVFLYSLRAHVHGCLPEDLWRPGCGPGCRPGWQPGMPGQLPSFLWADLPADHHPLPSRMPAKLWRKLPEPASHTGITNTESFQTTYQPILMRTKHMILLKRISKTFLTKFKSKQCIIQWEH